MPRLNVVRPADANETALGWRFALRNTEAPTAFALSRQNLPILDPAAIPDDAIERGAYVLRDADGGEPELILIGTGSEVSLCLEAADALDGVRVRVVSMPCMDTFTEADEAYREQVLPRSCRARIAVEAASPLGWDRWIGPEGAFVGMETFGESGPAKEVYEHFGITAERVADARKGAGGTMSTAAKVNERLAKLTAAGVSVWLDQIRRSLIEGGELARMVERGIAARGDRQPVDLREGDPRLRRLRRGARGARPRAARARRRSTTGSRCATCSSPPTCCAGVHREPNGRTASSRSRSRPTSPTTPSARSKPRGPTGRRSTAPT